MHWKEFFKHSLILFGIAILFGIVYFILTKIIRQLKYVNYLWIPTVIAMILIPLIYSIFIKKSVKELAIIAILFVVISSIVSTPIISITQSTIRESKGDAPIAIPLLEVFSINPISLIDTPICAPYSVRSINSGPNGQVELCPLQKNGFFAEIIIVGIIGFLIISLSMMTGSYLSKFKK